MTKRGVKRMTTKKATAGDTPKYRVATAGIDKLKASVEALDRIVTLAAAGASGDGVSESLRT